MNDKYSIIEKVASILDHDSAANFRTLERHSLVRAFEKCDMEVYPAVTGDPNGERASQNCICETCGNLHGDHPMDWRIIGYGDLPFLNVLCDGRRVKL